METFAWLNRIESVTGDVEDVAGVVKEEVSLNVYAKVGVLCGMCDMHQFISIADQCRRITSVLERKHMTVMPSEMKRLLNDLRQRCDHELKSRVFLSLSLQEGNQFSNPEEHWEPVISRFL